MLYLANPCGPKVIAAMHSGLLGLIDTPDQNGRSQVRQAHSATVSWCADNACFGKNYPGDEAWFSWLQSKAEYVDTCLFATAPDVVGDAQATLMRSLPWLAKIRELGYPAALVAQDGLESLAVPWDEFDVLFVGGTTAWKLGPHARRLVAQAKAHGKWVHMGRVNSEKRYRYAHSIGCDSADGTYLTFGPDVNLPKLLTWARVENQGALDFGEAVS